MQVVAFMKTSHQNNPSFNHFYVPTKFTNKFHQPTNKIKLQKNKEWINVPHFQFYESHLISCDLSSEK